MRWRIGSANLHERPRIAVDLAPPSAQTIASRNPSPTRQLPGKTADPRGQIEAPLPFDADETDGRGGSRRSGGGKLDRLFCLLSTVARGKGKGLPCEREMPHRRPPCGLHGPSRRPALAAARWGRRGRVAAARVGGVAPGRRRGALEVLLLLVHFFRT